MWYTVHGKILAEKMANLANRELFAKIILTNIQRYTENVFGGIYTDFVWFANFLADSFYLYGLPKISQAMFR